MRIFNSKYQMSNMNLVMYKTALRELIFNTEENLLKVDLGSILRSLRVLVMSRVEEHPTTPLIPERLLLYTMAQLEVELMTTDGLSLGKLMHILHPVLNHEVVMALGFNNALWGLSNRIEKLRKEGSLSTKVSSHLTDDLTFASLRYRSQNMDKNIA